MMHECENQASETIRLTKETRKQSNREKRGKIFRSNYVQKEANDKYIDTAAKREAVNNLCDADCEALMG